MDDIIEGKICVKTQEENHRNLIVSLTYKVEGKGASKTDELFSFEWLKNKGWTVKAVEMLLTA